MNAKHTPGPWTIGGRGPRLSDRDTAILVAQGLALGAAKRLADMVGEPMVGDEADLQEAADDLARALRETLGLLPPTDCPLAGFLERWLA